MELEQSVMKELKDKMDKAFGHFQDQLGTVRTGRASAAMVEGVMVEYYGTPTKLKELAGITVPEPRMILIQPWDVSANDEIMKALNKNQQGLNPRLEGKLIRVTVPELSQERRNECAKLAKQMAEEARVSMRSIRRDTNEIIKKGQKDSKITEDDHFRIEKDIQHKTDESIKKIDEVLHLKEKELMQI